MSRDKLRQVALYIRFILPPLQSLAHCDCSFYFPLLYARLLLPSTVFSSDRPESAPSQSSMDSLQFSPSFFSSDVPKFASDAQMRRGGFDLRNLFPAFRG